MIYHELPPFIQDHVVLNCQPALKFAPSRPALLPSFFEDAAQFMAPLLFIFAMSQFLLWGGQVAVNFLSIWGHSSPYCSAWGEDSEILTPVCVWPPEGKSSLPK